MDDRTLLELAAKAAGYADAKYQSGDALELRHGYKEALFVDLGEDFFYWNPLTHDGDAFRLAVELSLHVQIDFDGDQDLVYVFGDWYGGPEAPREPKGSDPCAAVRRAIVRAAAIMGEPGIRRAAAAIGQQQP